MLKKNLSSFKAATVFAVVTITILACVPFIVATLIFYSHITNR